MKFELDHTLSKDEAKKRLQKLITYWSTKYGVAVGWEGDVAKFNGKVKGIDIDAKFNIQDKRISGEGKDPGMLVRAAATAYIKKKVGEYLDPKKSDADLDKLEG